jgi:UDP-N-acetylmuramate dehydrogenase
MQRDIPLSRLTSYRIGGRARYFFDVKELVEIREAIVLASEGKLPLFVLGGGTNLLIADAGFPGVVVQPNLRGIESQSETVRVGAGVLFSDLLAFASERGLAGLEWAGGLPGTVGGAVRGNAGCFGGEVKDVIKEVESIEAATGALRTRTNAECAFGYRTSIFRKQKGEEIVLSVTLNLRKGDPHAIQDAIQEKIDYRRARHPLEYPNIGSIFKNVDVALMPKERLPLVAHVVKTDPFPVVPTAYLISEAGLKGVSFGGAMVSPKHPNFIVNIGEARAADVEALIALTKHEVKEKFGVELEEEVERVGMPQTDAD